jgi:hypothetical protein
MVGPVRNRFIRALVYMLVSAQLLLSVPVGTAFAGGAAAASAEMPCADSMPMADDGKPCPCCPDGAMDTAACLSACTASVAPVPMISLPRPVSSAAALESPLRISVARLAEPPLKPPPIA